MSAFREGDRVSLMATVAFVHDDGSLSLMTPSGARAYEQQDQVRLVAPLFKVGDEVRALLGKNKGTILALTEDKAMAWVRYPKETGREHFVSIEVSHLERWDGGKAEALDGWIEWGGGECPVEHGVRVEVAMRGGEGETEEGIGSFYRWSHCEAGTRKASDIIRYRVLPKEA